MTTLKELDEFAKKYIEQLARDTSRYEKIRTDMRGQVLLDEIKGRIKLVKDALDVFHNDPVAYGNYNFDKYVASLFVDILIINGFKSSRNAFVFV